MEDKWVLLYALLVGILLGYHNSVQGWYGTNIDFPKQRRTTTLSRDIEFGNTVVHLSRGEY